MTIWLRRFIGLGVALTVALVLAAMTQPLWAQSTYTLAPVEKRQFFDDNGQPLSGGLVYTYAAGTSTSQVVYRDSIGTPWTNPVVLDSTGRATIYLGATSYKFVVATSAAVQLYSQDNIQSIASAASQATLVGVCDGRLTLTSGTPITTADVTGATTIYFTPMQGSRCALYDGSTWNIRAFSELSLSLGADAANTNYDLFAYDNNGTMTLQRRAWTNNTARATDLTTQDGVPVRIGATTARYLGTYRTTGTAGQTKDTLADRYVYNFLHPSPRPVRREETASSWTYTTATFRQANANTLNAIGVVNGYDGGALALTVLAAAENTGTAANADVSIGTISTEPATGCPIRRQGLTTAARVFSLAAVCSLTARVGYTTFLWIEQSTASGTSTWYGNAGGAYQFGGLFGTWNER